MAIGDLIRPDRTYIIRNHRYPDMWPDGTLIVINSKKDRLERFSCTAILPDGTQRPCVLWDTTKEDTIIEHYPT